MNRFHYFDLEQKAKRIQPGSYNPSLQSLLFVKYFPKYQKEFSWFSQSGATKSKLKRIKIIQNFETSAKFHNRPDWRVLLANKMKSLKFLDSRSQSPKQFNEKLKFFSRIKSIQLFNVDIRLVPYHLINQHAKETCKYMRRLKSLRNLEFSPKLTESKSYVMELNSSRRLLNSLETLKFNFDWQHLSDQQISELIDSNKTLLKNATSLHLNTLHSSFHCRSFQNLRELCPKISTLSFEFSCREVYYHETKPIKFYGQPFEVDFNYLETLTVFQNLRSLNLNIADILTLVRDIALPPSIQHLILKFEEHLSKEIMLKIDKKFVDHSSESEELSKFFEENSLFIRFYEVFRGLQALGTLELIFPLECTVETYVYQSHLSRSLLKRISSLLKDLTVLSIGDPWKLKTNFVAKRKDPYLPQLLESCKNFAETLEALEIGALRIMYSNFDLESIRSKFTSLEKIKISAKFTQFQEDPNIETIGEFLQNIIYLGDTITLLMFDVYIDPTASALLSLFRQLNQLEKPKKLRIQLSIYFTSLEILKGSGISFFEGVKELLSDQERYPKIQGIFLKRVEKRNLIDGMKEFLKLYSEKFEKEIME